MQSILDLAQVPEHSVPFMEAVSNGTALCEGQYLFFCGEDWLMAVGYPLQGEYSEASFSQAFQVALHHIPLAQKQPIDCWAVSPKPLPFADPVDEDRFYILPASTLPPARLKRPLERASSLLRVDETKTFTPAHRTLWIEFTHNAKAMKPNVRELYAVTEKALRQMNVLKKSGDLRLLNAWDQSGNLVACLVLDYSPTKFSSYIIGAHSYAHSVPYASDLLFSVMLEKARLAGKEYVQLGLGVNEGILRFKRKWGAVPAQTYVMTAWQESPSFGRETADTFCRMLLATPANLSKRQLFATLPEQRPFAMLWELEKQGKKSWIAGSAHFFCYSFEQSFHKLFEKVDTVLFEGSLDSTMLNDVERIGKDMNQTAVCGSGKSLAGLLQEEEIQKLKKVVQGSQSALAHFFHSAWNNPADVCFFLNKTRHWYALFSLWTAFLERQGWKESVDLEAWRIANEMGLTTFGMETLEEQIASLEAVPIDRVLNFFRNCSQWKKTVKCNISAYLAGDLEKMIGTSAEFPTRTEVIINHRDQRFRERMRPFLEKGNCAVFVGSAHMLDLRGMLAEDGFSVHQVLPTWKHRLRAYFRQVKH